MNKIFITLLVFVSSTGCFAAPLTLPTVFSDHMVLQRERPVPVWGRTEAEAAVTVEFSGQKKTVTAGTDGKWRVNLDPLTASAEPRPLTVRSGEQQIVFADVLVGEVWLCSGQSNMEMALSTTENAAEEISKANYPYIRLYDTPRSAKRTPEEKIDAKWEVCTPETVKSFSGTAYYFGRKLHQDLGVPVGLLLSAWGGSRIEGWIPPCGFESISGLTDLYQITQNMPELSDPAKDRQVPSAIYNGMIYAHIPFSIRGAIWYQGEANRREGDTYAGKTRALLNGWRKLWGYELPFYFVQIAPFQCGNEDPALLPVLWEAQSEVARTVPETGMAVISDYATLNNIHPPNKKVPGTRLALLAEANDYGRNVVSTGPVFKAMEKQGDRLKVTFDSAEGLATRDGKAPDWFEIAGEDGVFKLAEAEIKGRDVILHSAEVPRPLAVRFAWDKLAVPNLINGAGLPASAFRAGGIPEQK